MRFIFCSNTVYIFFTFAYDTDVFYAYKNLKKLLLYKSSKLPYLTYCHLTWHCKASDAREKLKEYRNGPLGLCITYNESVEYSNFLNRASLPSLQNRCLHDIAILMYKVKHGMVPSNVSDIFSV